MLKKIQETELAYVPAEMELVDVDIADIICTSPGGSAEDDADGADADGWY